MIGVEVGGGDVGGSVPGPMTGEDVGVSVPGVGVGMSVVPGVDVGASVVSGAAVGPMVGLSVTKLGLDVGFSVVVPQFSKSTRKR